MSNKKQLKIVECSEREALRIHGIISDDSTSSEGGKSEFDEEYYNYKPPPIKIDRSKIVVISSLANTTPTSNKENTTTVKTDQTFYVNSSTYVNSSITDNTVSSNSSDRYSSSSINECPPVLTTDKRFTTKGVVDSKSIQKSIRESSTADNSVFSSTVPSTSATKISSSDSSNTPMETNLRSSQTCISAKGLNNDKKFSKSRTILSTNSNSTCEKLNSSTYVNSSIPVKTLSSNSSNRCSSLSINACPPVLTTDKKRKSKRKSTRKSPTADNSVFSSTSPSASVTKISSSERSKSTMETHPRSSTCEKLNSSTYVTSSISDNAVSSNSNNRYSSSFNECPPILTTDKSFTTKGVVQSNSIQKSIPESSTADNSVFSSTGPLPSATKISSSDSSNTPMETHLQSSKTGILAQGLNNDNKFSKNETILSTNSNSTCAKLTSLTYDIHSSIPVKTVSSNSSDRNLSINVCPPVLTTNKKQKSKRKLTLKSSTADNSVFSSSGPSHCSKTTMETHQRSSTCAKLNSSTYVNSFITDNAVSSNSSNRYASSSNECPPVLTTDKSFITKRVVESKSIQKSTHKSSTADNLVFSSTGPSTSVTKISFSNNSKATMETLPRSSKTYIYNKISKNKTNLRTNSNITCAKIVKRREAMKIYHYNFEDSDSSKSGKSEFDEEYYNNKPPPIEIDRSKIVVVSNNLANITMTSNKENTTTVKTDQTFYVNSAISVNSSFPDNSVSSSSSNRYSSSSINVCPPVHTTDERFIIKGMIESKSTQKSIHKSSIADNLAFSSTGPSTSATKISSSGSSSAPMETHLQSSKTYVSVQGLNNDKQFSRNKTILSTNFNSTYEKLNSSTYVNSSVPDNTVSSNSYSSINVCPPILTTDKIPIATYGMVESKSIQKSTRKSSTADNSVFSSLSTCVKKMSSSDSSEASMETHPESLKTCISEKKRCSQKILVKPILSNQQDNDNEPAFDEIVPEIIDEPLITYDEIHLIGEDIEEHSNSCFNCCIIL